MEPTETLADVASHGKLTLLEARLGSTPPPTTEELSKALLRALWTDGVDSDVSLRLLAAGADPSFAEDDGATPLLVALLHGCRDVAKELLEKGADPDRRTTKSLFNPFRLFQSNVKKGISPRSYADGEDAEMRALFANHPAPPTRAGKKKIAPAPIVPERDVAPIAALLESLVDEPARASFRAKVAPIDVKNQGPFSYFTDCVLIAKEELAPAAARLPASSWLRRAIESALAARPLWVAGCERHRMLRSANLDDGDAANPILVDPVHYEPEMRRALKSDSIVAMQGDTVMCVWLSPERSLGRVCVGDEDSFRVVAEDFAAFVRAEVAGGGRGSS